MPSLPEPPDDQSENRAWIDEQAERVAVLARTQLRKIVLRAYDAYLSTLTAAGDLAAFDSIPQEWGVFVGEQLLDEIDGVYRSGAVAAWNQAPTTAALGESAALAWAAVVNENAVSYAAQASNRLAGVGHDIWMKVNSEVTEAIRQGTGTEALKEEIERLTGFSEFRADTIARTEVGSAFVNGNYEAQAALGEYGAVFKEWLAVGDARTRPEHLEVSMNNPIIPFEDSWEVGGDTMRAPHDETASAGNVINCRCDVLWYYPGDTLPDGTLVQAPGAEPEGEQGTAGPEVAEELEQAAQNDIINQLLSDDDAVSLATAYTRSDGSLGVDLTGANDPMMEYIARRQGFDGLPEVLDRSAFEQRITEPGYLELWRGVSEQQFVQQFRSGDYFGGQGIYGSGTYTTDLRETALRSARNEDERVLRMALRPDARVIDYRAIERELIDAMDEASPTAKAMLDDEGRFAAARGYDAIVKQRSNGERYVIVLNRSALIVEA